MVAIAHRSSLVALGSDAQSHFGIDATTLSTFAVIQLIVYAGMQVPVGALLDKFGSSTLILVGCVLMMLGQVAMATVHDVTLAILARVLIGMGDACTFISVIRMIPHWFALRQIPTVTQLTGLVGQAGQFISVIPLAITVGVFGWVPGFFGLAALGALSVILGFIALRDEPGLGTPIERLTGRLGRTSREARSFGASDSATELIAATPPATSQFPAKPNARGFTLWKNLRRTLRVPGIRLAYWMHFTSGFAPLVFLLLWGSPFLIGGAGLSPATSSTLLSVAVFAGMVSGFVLGPITSRFVRNRVEISIGITVTIALTWAAVLLWPGVPPMWLLVLLMIMVPVGGPTSVMAFEVSRTHAPRSFAGLSTGIVNTGSFTAALLVILFIGVILDLQGAGDPANYSLAAFRWAFAIQFPFWVFGTVMVLIEARHTRDWMQQSGRSLG